MTRIAMVVSEPLRPRMAGIGIRYYELARRLPGHGIEVLLLSPSEHKVAAQLPLPPGVEVLQFDSRRLPELLAGCQGAVAQGQLANDLLLQLPALPVAIDLYDPWLVENLSYVETLGFEAFRNDHATWVLQMARGDFFLCSSEEQRDYYLGFLTALGRVNPERVAQDPDLRSLITPVPFGVPEELPPHRPLLPPRPPGQALLLFGGLYDWYDPWTLLDALGRLRRDTWRLLLLRSPNAASTPQRLLHEVERSCRRLGWWGSRVQVRDWVAAERRYDLLREVDLLVSPHRPSLETSLSLRTRFLDAVVAGCPIVTSEGGAMSRLLASRDAAWVVPPGDAAALAEAVEEALANPAAHRSGAREIAAEFRWDRVMAPLVAFCREPRLDPTKDRFVHRPVTATPAEPRGLRLKRRLRRLAARWTRRWQG